MTRSLFVTALLIGLVSSLSAAEPAATAEDIRAAVVKALPLIQKGSNGHRAKRTCFACHHQAIPLFALTAARSRGISIKEEDVQKHLQHIADFLGKNREGYREGRGQGGQADTAGYALWTLETGGWKPDETTAAVAEYLLRRHKDLDHWRSTANRPPSEKSSFTSTYVSLRGLQAFGTKEQKKRIDERIRVVRGWLEKTPAKDTEDRVFRLWAMQRAGSEAKKVQAAARELIETQREDGGWAQRDDMKSDAYATGTALAVLHHAAGLAANDPIYQRGIKYLLASQAKDGTWHVHSRSKPFQTYFESGFPNGKDQFISLAASSWATTVLALALPPVERRAASR
ncbi:MAG TPA: prenyltransferase/squalene oxidase repeat-containing protein [Gemmataceae bacterium]|nr:prenyltransferase/squalene oxidase repeat-containing protein [Gemmataceae bacterium]